MRALLIPTDGLPRTIDLPEGLEPLQVLVGGDIEPYPALDPNVTLWVNEDGISTRRPNRAVYATQEMIDAGYVSPSNWNRVLDPGECHTVLFGEIIATGYDPESGDNVDLTTEQIARLKGYFTYMSRPQSGKLEAIRISERKRRGESIGSDWDALELWIDRKVQLFSMLDKPMPAAFGGCHVIDGTFYVTEDDYKAVLPSAAERALFYLLANADRDSMCEMDRRDIIAHQRDEEWLLGWADDHRPGFGVEAETYWTQYFPHDFSDEELAEMRARRPDLFADYLGNVVHAAAPSQSCGAVETSREAPATRPRSAPGEKRAEKSEGKEMKPHRP